MALNQDDPKVQDAVSGSWVDTRSPLAWRPYLRLSRFDRPVGAWLLFLPCVFGAFLAGAMASVGVERVVHFLIVAALGSWLMRGAGCTWNDIVDREIDAQVERTKSRPLPSGAVSVRGAVIWMFAQMIVALFALLSLSPFAIGVALSSLIIVAIYPFAKRFTNWPQLVLGLAFNWGVFVAFAQLYGTIVIEAFFLYVGMIFWTLYYDTIYAFQDKKDDEKIGVKSTARKLESHAKGYLSLFASGSVSLMIVAAFIGLSLSLAFLFFILGALLAGFGFLRQLSQYDQNDRTQSLALFRGNVLIGQIIAVFWGVGWLTMIVNI